MYLFILSLKGNWEDRKMIGIKLIGYTTSNIHQNMLAD